MPANLPMDLGASLAPASNGSIKGELLHAFNSAIERDPCHYL